MCNELFPISIFEDIAQDQNANDNNDTEPAQRRMVNVAYVISIKFAYQLHTPPPSKYNKYLSFVRMAIKKENDYLWQ